MPIHSETYKHHNDDFTFISAKAAATQYAHYTRVAVCRNPYARLASAWKYTCVDSPGWWESIPAYGMRTGMTFEQFVNAVCRQHDSEMNIHYRPQVSLLTYRSAPAYDILCKMETLQEDWTKVQDRFPGLPNLTRERVSGVDWGPLYTAELQTKVLFRYAEDFLRFGYLECTQ